MGEARASTAAAPATEVASAGVRLRVLHCLTPPDGTTRYVDQMLGGAGGDVDATTFSWRTALLGRYDVLHVHWPEQLVRSPSGWRRAARHVALRALLARVRWTRTPVVRTLHNPVPHERGTSAEARALAAVDDATTLYVLLNPATRAPRDAPAVHIPLAHYRDVFARHPRAAARRGHLVTVGLLRPYKGVEALIEAFRALPDEDLRLTVAGRPTADLAPTLTAAAAADDRVRLDLRFVPDATFVQHVTSAELVVLPYREMTNSGILVAALSLERPCLVPASPTNAAIAAEVGPGWVLQYEGPFDERALRDGLAAARSTPRPAPPDLGARDWATVGAAHLAAYRAALAHARGRRP